MSNHIYAFTYNLAHFNPGQFYYCSRFTTDHGNAWNKLPNMMLETAEKYTSNFAPVGIQELKLPENFDPNYKFYIMCSGSLQEDRSFIDYDSYEIIQFMHSCKCLSLHIGIVDIENIIYEYVNDALLTLIQEKHRIVYGDGEKDNMYMISTFIYTFEYDNLIDMKSNFKPRITYVNTLNCMDTIQTRPSF